MQNLIRNKYIFCFLSLKKNRKLLLYANNPIKYLFPSPTTLLLSFLKFLILGALEYFSSTPKTPYDLNCKYFSYPFAWAILRFKQTGK